MGDGASGVKLLGMGNPLLDIIASVDEELLKRHNLKSNGFRLAEDKDKEYYEELKKTKGVLYVPGGATQNTIRVCQALLKEKHSTAYSGCIGSDGNGKEMCRLLEKEGIVNLYVVTPKPEHKTGVCGVAVHGADRSLVTYLGAANDFPLESVRSEKLWNHILNAQVIYSSGFFMTGCFEGMKMVAEQAVKQGKPYCINLAAEFIIDVFFKELMTILKYATYVFGNEAEFGSLAKKMGYETNDLSYIAEKVCALDKIDPKISRTVICTQGSKQTIISTDTQTFYDPIPLVDNIVDTNGAGDAYVGGFLYGVVLKQDLPFCCKAGTFAAQHIIQRSGCSFDFHSIPKDLIVAS